ncbi:hypothetical protein L6164_018700 [Bauhinia variegata]|uniref:Uncharacterized protein n=1 Tax=Bauhinia variegata TaxID=167791 RepID=A0ACB9NCR6_BAUVA|nr:hypothetical protein L6164_018700 [Bauhinia variegata]
MSTCDLSRELAVTRSVRGVCTSFRSSREIKRNMDKRLSWIPAPFRRSDEIDQCSDLFSDTVFGFWEDVVVSSESSSTSSDPQDDDGEEEDNNFCTPEENKAFWEEQDQLLQSTLRRTSSIESTIRQATKETLRELNMSEMQYCICRQPTVGCRNCLRREICNRLLNLGHNCAIFKSKWRSSSEIPSGEHTYLEVTDKSNVKKGEVKVVIELNFRGEFEMARANEEYNKLMSRLPEVYVGKTERLRVLIKILCSAAKKCMTEKKMHLGPWRKRKYMQAKWLGTCDMSEPPPLPMEYSVRPPKPKASMLTFDLLENIPSFHCTVVEVV